MKKIVVVLVMLVGLVIGGNAKNLEVTSEAANRDGVCESFVNAVTNSKGSKWKFGAEVYPTSKIKAGTILGSHQRLGSDTLSEEGGHIVVLVKIERDAIWVMDQNAYFKLKSNPNKGIVGIHKIKFGTNVTDKNDQSYYAQNNAYNYRIIKLK